MSRFFMDYTGELATVNVRYKEPDGSCVDIIETAKCLETWYGTDPETGAGTKTISK